MMKKVMFFAVMSVMMVFASCHSDKDVNPTPSPDETTINVSDDSTATETTDEGTAEIKDAQAEAQGEAAVQEEPVADAQPAK